MSMTEETPFDNPRVQEAIALCMKPLNDDTRAEAKKLLTKAGYPKGFKANLPAAWYHLKPEQKARLAAIGIVIVE